MALHMLEIQSGKYKGRRVKVADPEVLVGRDEEAKIRIASEEVSRKHCILVPQKEGVLVRDLGSSNGTFINGRPVPGEALLEPGETLTVGPMTFKLLGQPRAQAKPAPVQLPKGASTDSGALDDDIASWLAEEGGAPGLHDTTVIKMPPPKSGDSSVEIPIAQFASSLPPQNPSRRREFKSTAEEAQDIIARWQASQQTHQ